MDQRPLSEVGDLQTSDPRPVPSVPRIRATAAAMLAIGLGLSLAWAGTRAPTDRGLEPQAAATSQAQPPAAGVAPSSSGAAQARGETKAKKAVVPFEMLPTNHMVVRARINGKGPYRLIFDLGAPIMLLNNRASEESGVVKADAPRSFLMGMRGEAEIDELRAGDLTVAKLPVIVLDHPILKALGDVLGHRIDGIMGFTLFARYKTTIDYQARQMSFEPVAYRVRDLLKELPERMLGPKVARHRVLAPAGLWGLRLGEPTGGLDSPGVPIAAVADGSPAAQGGLKAGDVITALDGRWTATTEDVFAAAADVEPGRAATVVLLRDGKEMTLAITPADGI
jgi:hypothetical protein